MDASNALIVLRLEHPELLRERPVVISVLDMDAEGPEFGARALAALRSEGGPLTRPRSLEAFRALAGSAGWSVTAAIERPFSYDVSLAPEAER